MATCVRSYSFFSNEKTTLSPFKINNNPNVKSLSFVNILYFVIIGFFFYGYDTVDDETILLLYVYCMYKNIVEVVYNLY